MTTSATINLISIILFVVFIIGFFYTWRRAINEVTNGYSRSPKEKKPGTNSTGKGKFLPSGN